MDAKGTIFSQMLQWDPRGARLHTALALSQKVLTATVAK